MIDTGCPFAHPAYQRTDRFTRILALWDQDPDRPALTPIRGHAEPPDFGRGIEVGWAAIDAWLSNFRDEGGTLREESCYRVANYFMVPEGFAHGAAVLNLAAGPLPLEARYPSEVAGRFAPPTWQASDDAAGKADIVFVQLPRHTVEDSSSASLPLNLLDGLRYIVARAGEGPRRIVVNISDGTSRTLHDGHSIIEDAMQALVAEVAEGEGRTLDIVIAAGNAYKEARHAVLSRRAKADSMAVLRLPPDGDRPAFMNIGIPARTEDGQSLRFVITPPSRFDCAAFEVKAGDLVTWSLDGQPCFWMVVPPQGSARTQAMAVWAPTSMQMMRRGRAPAGDWRIECVGQSGPVDLWISLTQNNLGGPASARQARFIDADGRYEPRRFLREAKEDASRSPSVVRRARSLNGLATIGPGLGIWVVGARMMRVTEGQDPRSPYSSVGPSIGREQIDAVMCADFAPGQAGIRVGGTRAGDVDIVSGTSFAAPQFVRYLVNQR